jgi:hypothetical protein
VFATIHSGAPSGRISYLALPRAKALGYSVLPFHGRYALRRTPNAVSALTPLGKQSKWMPDYKNNHR